MSSTTRSWIVAASIGAVETLKDQGMNCRWSNALRSIRQHAKNSRSFSSQSSANSVSNNIRDEKMKQSEDSLRRVMYLSCWGPNN
ncbi:hypothetical protein L484_018719 [Morus notabilis]|uniref:Wound-responsive family protein n=1 Tax=Morus notabilis TaxID=981085 RepID=W9RGL6_9ROSA|nr:hypothetical protein L484_018719 [Morus notabilis]